MFQITIYERSGAIRKWVTNKLSEDLAGIDLASFERVLIVRLLEPNPDQLRLPLASS